MKKAMLATTILVGTLLSGAHVAAAAPPVTNQPQVLAPTAATVATRPQVQPCQVRYTRCDVTAPTRTKLPTDIATPTDTTEPAEPSEPTRTKLPTATANPANPAETPEANEPPVVTTTRQVPATQKADAPAGVPVPNRIDTGAGPSEVAAAPASLTDWWPLAVPLLALLGLAAAGTVLVIRRSERRSA
jgi:hypothetical protein